MEPRSGWTYRAAGVDLEAGERAKAGLKELVARTRDRYTLSELGGFGGLYALGGRWRDPVLVASADGVGTKLKVAFVSGRHHTVGRDLVNHCVNDILVQGATPLFFLDYLAVGRLEEGVVEAVVGGVVEGCLENGCTLLGGETAQMPDFYAPGEYDLAGFIVGVVEREEMLDGSRVRPGDRLVGLASSGLHTNGYTLARKIVFEAMGLGPWDPFPGLGMPVADLLLTVHKSYLASLGPLIREGRIHALAHITGGGIEGNLPRSLGPGTTARLIRSSWEVPPLFRRLQAEGGVEEEEMFRVFNMGVGMIAIVDAGEAETVVGRLRACGEQAWILGEVVEGGEGVVWV